MQDIFEIVLRSFEYGSIYALAALSIILVYKTSYITNFSQGVLGMFNTYVVAKLVSSYGVNYYLSILIGVASAVSIGFLIDLIIMRHTKKVTPVGKQIITLGLISIIMGISPLVFGVYDLSLRRFIPTGEVNLLGAIISINALFNIVFGLSIMVVLFNILLKTKLGLAIRTTASSEVTAKLMGVPTRKITLMSWAVGGVLSLFAGLMAAPFSNVSLTFMNDVQITAFLACVLGGFQTFYGPVVGAYVIAVLSNLLQIYLPNGTIWGKPVLYLLILLFLSVRPFGLFGKKTVKKV